MAVDSRENRAEDQGLAFEPDMPGYQHWKTKPFSRMVTEQDQIWWLYWNMRRFATWEALEDAEQDVSDLTDKVEDLSDKFDRLADLVNQLKQMLCALAQNSLSYDVTTGLFRPTIAANRRMWQAQMFYGMTVADLSTYTVAEAAQMNVRHVAVDGREEYMRTSKADPAIPHQEGYACAYFNPDEYIKKTDLTLIDSDNLEDHVIMGVLTSDAATDYPKPAPYLRRFVAADLTDTWVRTDDHVIANYDGPDSI